uniref:Leucine-rich repeat flightless-interacting protein 2 n=1 Tax=Callorhinchus milii TaxID=7868 RepID=A0A4W3IDA9_CALMI
MGTPGAGRKRTPIKDRFSAEDEALSHIAREAEARLAAKRAARAEARDIRMKELERQQKEFHRPSGSKWGEIHQWMVGTLFSLSLSLSPHPCTNQPASRNAVAGLSPATLASLGGSSSRRGSGDSSSVLDPDVSLSELRDIYDLKDQIQDVEGRYMQGLKELKDSLSEVEEKYKKAMVSNAQLDNEKSNLIYQVDTLKDVIEELEEQMSELYRENVEKSKELERQKHMCIVSQHKAEELKEGIRQRDELIEENKCMQQRVDTLTREVFDLQETVIWKDKKIGALERQKDYFDCIKNERDELRDELAELREKSKKHGLVIIPEGTPNGDINHEPIVGAITVVSQEAAQVLEGCGQGSPFCFSADLTGLSVLRCFSMFRALYKCKFLLLNASFCAVIFNGAPFVGLQVSRLEGQVLRYKSSAENSEKIEDELKAEKRRLQRELRSAMDKTEEMEMTNSHLVKRLEKMKANRNALLSQQ